MKEYKCKTLAKSGFESVVNELATQGWTILTIHKSTTSSYKYDIFFEREKDKDDNSIKGIN